MKDTDRPELIRVLELDYEKTTQLIEGIVGTSFTIRGWGITLVAALVGLTFQAQLWEIAVLAVVVILLIALVDGYHSWLYGRILRHATNIERVLGLYYVSLARGDDDPEAHRAFEVAILAYQFGRFAEIREFGLKTLLRDALSRWTFVALYATLLICALVSLALVLFPAQSHSAKFECTAVQGAANVFLCKPK